MIYEYAFVSTEPIEPIIPDPAGPIVCWWDSSTHYKLAKTQPALTRVCHEVRDETLPVYYARNHSIFDGSDYSQAWFFSRWVRIIGLSLVRLTRISFRFYLKPAVRKPYRKMNLNRLVKDEAYHAGIDHVVRSVGTWIHVHAKLVQERQGSVIMVVFTEPVDPASQFLEYVAMLVKSQRETKTAEWLRFGRDFRYHGQVQDVRWSLGFLHVRGVVWDY